MNKTELQISLDTPLKQLKQLKDLKRLTIFLLKEYGVTNVRELLAVSPVEFLETKGVGKKIYMDLKQFQEKYKNLLSE